MLFEVSGSEFVPEIVTTLSSMVSAVPVGICMVSVRVSDVPGAIVPMVQVVPSNVPVEVEEDDSVAPAGRVSVSVTPVSVLGPLLVAVTVYW